MHRYCAIVYDSCVLCWNATPAAAQKSERDSAIALVSQGKSNEALPILEKLVAGGANDIAVLENLGLALLKVSGAITDATARQQQRVRARAMFEKAVQLGSPSEQIRALLQAIPADGGADPSYSANAEADDAMQKAEAAYSAGNYRSSGRHGKDSQAERQRARRFSD